MRAMLRTTRQAVRLLALALLAVASLAAASPAASSGPVAPSGAATAPEEIVVLGRLLFFDAGLSEPPGQACATCHEPGHAFTDPDTSQPTSKGAHRHRFGSRNTPTVMYMAFSPPFRFDPDRGGYVGGQFWDGRAATLEAQARHPLLNPVEMANPDERAVVEKLRASRLAARFRRIWGEAALDDDRAFDRVTEALAAFQRSNELAPFTSRYDAWLAGKAKLSDEEMRGLRLFEDATRGNCASCHPSRPAAAGERPLFTDFRYVNLGVPRNPANPFYAQAREHNPDGARHLDLGLGAAVGKPSEHGKFKVPTLRNVDLTPPYMHNGYFTSLRAAVAFHARDARERCASEAIAREALPDGCWPAPEVAANVERGTGRLGLADGEIDAIVAFLRTLTDGFDP